jgi:hypothetical protein
MIEVAWNLGQRWFKLSLETFLKESHLFWCSASDHSLYVLWMSDFIWQTMSPRYKNVACSTCFPHVPWHRTSAPSIGSTASDCSKKSVSPSRGSAAHRSDRWCMANGHTQGAEAQPELSWQHHTLVEQAEESNTAAMSADLQGIHSWGSLGLFSLQQDTP